MDSLLDQLDNGTGATERSPPRPVLVPVLLPVALDQTYDYLPPAGALDWGGEAQADLLADVAVLTKAPSPARAPSPKGEKDAGPSDAVRGLSDDVGDALPPAPGSFVLVPFGTQMRIGVVWPKSLGNDPGKPVNLKKLKAIDSVLDVPPLPEIGLRFAEWIARYTLTPLGMVLRMMMSAQSVFEPEKPRFGVRYVAEAADPPRMSPARQRVLDAACDGMIRTKAALAELAGCTTGVVDGLVTSGNLVDVALPERKPARLDPAHKANSFTEDQERAVETLRSAVDARAFSVSLLDGVTGSGKTEVYFEAVARTLAQGKQALIMLPEIALTSQFMGRFQARFGGPPAEWHSALSPADRGRIWKWVAKGEARVVVGARSALFLPYPDLGLVIVDEEHDAGFKQEDRVHYQARDMAVVRGNLGGFPVILASATPSIESHVNARTARYRHVILPGRFSGAELPDVQAIDLRAEPPDKGHWLSPRLVDAVTETIAKGQQSLLYLNRRGYAPLTLCRTCGHRLECPQCTAWLVEHRFRNRLHCHHCGFSLPVPEKCPKCESDRGMVACGPGVERVAEEVAERWPDARVALLSSDLIPSLVEMREIIKKIEAREADIIIGTQIVAKGHHFPGLALVGIVDGDLGLAQGADPRAGERTFQLLHQVTGRAGRAEVVGHGLVQTYNPTHPVMQAIVSGDRDAFIEREIQVRQRGLLPPYGRLAALIVSARDKGEAERAARLIAKLAPFSERISVLGPAEAPLAIIRGRHRWRLLVKAPRDLDMQAYLREWLLGLPPIKGDVRLTVDVDPYGFL